MLVIFKIDAVNVAAYAGYHRADVAINLRIIRIYVLGRVDVFLYTENQTGNNHDA